MCDGIARLLTETDVATLKKSHKDLEGLNSDMVKASLLVSAHAVDTIIFWRVVARCITHITNKGKFTFEGVVYTSLEKIKRVNNFIDKRSLFRKTRRTRFLLGAFLVFSSL